MLDHFKRKFVTHKINSTFDKTATHIVIFTVTVAQKLSRSGDTVLSLIASLLMAPRAKLELIHRFPVCLISYACMDKTC